MLECCAQTQALAATWGLPLGMHEDACAWDGKRMMFSGFQTEQKTASRRAAGLPAGLGDLQDGPDKDGGRGPFRGQAAREFPGRGAFLGPMVRGTGGCEEEGKPGQAAGGGPGVGQCCRNQEKCKLWQGGGLVGEKDPHSGAACCGEKRRWWAQ